MPHMSKLTFGYLFDFRNPRPWPHDCQREWAQLYADLLDQIVWTEQAGFAAAWVPEHHGAADGYLPSPIPVLAAIAARTSRIRIGSAIALAPLYHPVRFAEDCAVLDILSGGRIEMALAIGYRRSEYESYGLDFTRRGSRFDEFLQIVKALWAGETVDFAGQHFTLKGAKLCPPALRGRVPLHIGGFADKAMARVAKYADGYFGNEEVCGLYIDKLKALGRNPAEARILIQLLFTVVASDPAAALEELAPYYHYVNNVYGEWLAEDRAIGLDDTQLEVMSLEAFKASGILQILTPEQAVAKFRRMQDRMPALEHVMLMCPPGLPADRFRHYARLFADEVMPAFA